MTKKIAAMIMTLTMLMTGVIFTGGTTANAFAFPVETDEGNMTAYTETKTCNVFGDPSTANSEENRTEIHGGNDMICYGTLNFYVEDIPEYTDDCTFALFLGWTDFKLNGVNVESIENDDIITVSTTDASVCNSIKVVSAPAVNGISTEEDRDPMSCYLKFLPIDNGKLDNCELDFVFTATARFLVVKNGRLTLEIVNYKWYVPHFVKNEVK